MKLCGHILAGMVVILVVAAAPARAAAPPPALTTATLPLWQQQAPRALGTADQDIPTLTLFLPASPDRKLSAVIICPGGGYSTLANGHEGATVACWLTTQGVAAFVLKYRLPVHGYRHPVPLMDAQRALSLVRARAKEWNLDPDRIGIMGFSAGGHLASTLSTHFHRGLPGARDPIDRQSCRPDFAILIYPVITMKELTHGGSRRNLLGSFPDPRLVESLSNETRVTKDTPPTFLVHASDDGSVPVRNSVNYYLALIKAGVPAEMHIYENGGHGFGMRFDSRSVAGGTWQDRLADWLRARGLAPALTR